MHGVRGCQCTGCVSVSARGMDIGPWHGVRERQCTGCVSVSARGQTDCFRVLLCMGFGQISDKRLPEISIFHLN